MKIQNVKVNKNYDNLFDIAKSLVQNAESFSPIVYSDSLGNKTIGYGFDLIDVVSQGWLAPNTTTISLESADFILTRLLWKIFYQIENSADIRVCYDKQTDTVKAVFVDMIYNLGFKGFSEFVVFLNYMNVLQYDDAVVDLTNSLWYSQVKTRAIRNCFIILSHSNSLYLI